MSVEDIQDYIDSRDSECQGDPDLEDFLLHFDVFCDTTELDFLPGEAAALAILISSRWKLDMSEDESMDRLIDLCLEHLKNECEYSCEFDDDDAEEQDDKPDKPDKPDEDSTYFKESLN